MEWRAKEDWSSRNNDPDSPEERFIHIATYMNDMITCYCLFPGIYYDMLNENSFDPIRNHPDFEKLCERVKALTVTRSKEN